jgi:transcriptional regulator with XRE-family HTH domain
MSLDDLAKAVGTTKAQILAYEKGLQVPEPRRIRQLAAALGTHPKELSSTASFEFTSLAALRRACGLSACDVVVALNLSPKAYRRFETYGIAPARRPALLDELSALFLVPRNEIEVTMRRSPVIMARMADMERLLAQMRVSYVEAPQPWQAPLSDAPSVIQLAAMLGRSPASIARLLCPLFGDLRERFLRIHLHLVTATFDVEPVRRKKAETLATKGNERYLQEADRLASRLDAFLREALPSDQWHTLVQLRASDQWADPATLGIRAKDLSALPAAFIQQRRSNPGGEWEYKISEVASSHVRIFIAWYRALYPSVKVADTTSRQRSRVSRPSTDRF